MTPGTARLETSSSARLYETVRLSGGGLPGVPGFFAHESIHLLPDAPLPRHSVVDPPENGPAIKVRRQVG